MKKSMSVLFDILFSYASTNNCHLIGRMKKKKGIKYIYIINNNGPIDKSINR